MTSTRFLTIAIAILAACTARSNTPAAGDSAVSTQPTAANDTTRIDRVLRGLRPPVEVAGRPADGWTLRDRMDHYKVPGVSIAVIEGGQIAWARGFGVKEAGKTDSVTPTTLFQAASISKPVTATAMLRLVERGTLNLDTNVNHYLTSWKVPDNRFTATEKVTLRRIVSHSAGLTVHGFPGYATNEPLPTVVQVLDGAKPANTAPVRVDTTPGAIERYSGGGTTIMQQLLVDVTAARDADSRPGARAVVGHDVRDVRVRLARLVRARRVRPRDRAHRVSREWPADRGQANEVMRDVVIPSAARNRSRPGRGPGRRCLLRAGAGCC